MKFVWESDFPEYYEVKLCDGEKELMKMHIHDYSTEYSVKNDKENRQFRREAYSVGTTGCKFTFDCDEDYKNHKDENGKPVFGYQGKVKHTIDEVKRFCEEYIASCFIIDYDKELEKLQERKNQSDAIRSLGYTGDLSLLSEYEGK